MKEPDWERFRRRARRRSGAIMGLVVGPIVLFGWALKILEPHHYPAGDIRNEPLFWIIGGLLTLVVIGTLIAGSIRELTRR
jgi:hypothetical protein